MIYFIFGVVVALIAVYVFERLWLRLIIIWMFFSIVLFELVFAFGAARRHTLQNNPYSEFEHEIFYDAVTMAHQDLSNPVIVVMITLLAISILASHVCFKEDKRGRSDSDGE